jgi:hypothetical protein
MASLKRKIWLSLLGFAILAGMSLGLRTYADPHAVFYTSKGVDQVFGAVLYALNQTLYVEAPDSPVGEDGKGVPTKAENENLPDDDLVRDFAGRPRPAEQYDYRIRVRNVTADNGDLFYRLLLVLRASDEAARVESGTVSAFDLSRVAKELVGKRGSESQPTESNNQGNQQGSQDGKFGLNKLGLPPQKAIPQKSKPPTKEQQKLGVGWVEDFGNWMETSKETILGFLDGLKTKPEGAPPMPRRSGTSGSSGQVGGITTGGGTVAQASTSNQQGQGYDPYKQYQEDKEDVVKDVFKFLAMGPKQSGGAEKPGTWETLGQEQDVFDYVWDITAMNMAPERNQWVRKKLIMRDYLEGLDRYNQKSLVAYTFSSKGVHAKVNKENVAFRPSAVYNTFLNTGYIAQTLAAANVNRGYAPSDYKIEEQPPPAVESDEQRKHPGKKGGGGGKKSVQGLQAPPPQPEGSSLPTPANQAAFSFRNSPAARPNSENHDTTFGEGMGGGTIADVKAVQTTRLAQRNSNAAPLPEIVSTPSPIDAGVIANVVNAAGQIVGKVDADGNVAPVTSDSLPSQAKDAAQALTGGGAKCDDDEFKVDDQKAKCLHDINRIGKEGNAQQGAGQQSGGIPGTPLSLVAPNNPLMNGLQSGELGNLLGGMCGSEGCGLSSLGGLGQGLGFLNPSSFGSLFQQLGGLGNLGNLDFLNNFLGNIGNFQGLNNPLSSLLSQLMQGGQGGGGGQTAPVRPEQLVCTRPTLNIPPNQQWRLVLLPQNTTENQEFINRLRSLGYEIIPQIQEGCQWALAPISPPGRRVEQGVEQSDEGQGA